MRFAVVALCALLVAMLTSDPRWRPHALGAAFALRLGLPSIAGNIDAFGAMLHASTILILSFAIVWPLAGSQTKKSAAFPQPLISPMCYLVIALVAAGTIAMSDSPAFAVGLTLNQIVAPFLFLTLIVKASFHDPSLPTRAGRFFAACCVAESLIALCVNFGLFPQPFLGKYDVVDTVIGAGRQPGTLDHPLTLGLLLAAGIPMVLYFKSRTVSYLSVLIMVAGIALTQSRIAIAAAALGVIYLLFVGSKSFIQRAGLIVIAVGGFASLSLSGIFLGLMNRIGYDEGSQRGRQIAVQVFVEHWSEFSFSGVGLESSKQFFLSHGMTSSGESAAISYAVGIGIPLTLLYFSLMAWLIYRGIRSNFKSEFSPASAASTIVLMSIQFYSSITTESAAGLILWATIGIAFAARSDITSQTSKITSRITLPPQMVSKSKPVKPIGTRGQV